jgi:aspartate/tyrosine/aromatic aminotransferase
LRFDLSYSIISFVEAVELMMLILQAGATTIMAHSHRVVYTTTYNAPGDSGAALIALILRNGSVVAMHQEGVNHLKKRIRLGKRENDLTSDEKESGIADSIDSAIGSVSQKCIGFLVTGFPPF